MLSNFDGIHSYSTCWLFLMKNKTTADARVAWPHNGTSDVGVNHLRENREVFWNTSMFSRILLFFPFSLLPDDGDDIEGTTNAVSDKFISVAIFCFSSSEMSFSSRQTAAGFPPVISKHLDNYKYGRVIISFLLIQVRKLI